VGWSYVIISSAIMGALFILCLCCPCGLLLLQCCQKAAPATVASENSISFKELE